MRKIGFLVVASLALAMAACSSEGSDGTSDVADADVGVADTADVADTDIAETADVTDAVDADSVEVVEDAFPARALPFSYARPEDGEPIPETEVGVFTKTVTGLWHDIDYLRWVLRTSTGVDASTGKDDYLAWHNDVTAVKAGDTVTFRHRCCEHNMWIPGSMMFTEVVNGYLLTGDWELAKLAEQYCKGLSASIKGFVMGDDDPAPFLMARAVFPIDHEFTLDEENWQDDGRKKNILFTSAYIEDDGWNAKSFAWPDNPTWGDIWVTNMRSKDDVRAIVRSVAFLPYVIADAQDEWVREACQETADLMVGFNKDIVDNGYYIRTKGPDGVAYSFDHEDLGSYVLYTQIDPQNECTHRLASDFLAYGEPLTNDCGNGWGTVYEKFATVAHYYNYPIVWDYHMAAILNALVYGYGDIALPLLEGMSLRMDDYLDPDTEQPGAEHHDWQRDMAVLLVQAASVGLPLTASEARHVQKHWLQAVEDYKDWPRWDLWADEVPDGEYSGGELRPRGTDEGIPVESLILFLEYCNSPFKNPAGASFVDCDKIADRASWGE